jgi:hypothetical protein
MVNMKRLKTSLVSRPLLALALPGAPLDSILLVNPLVEDAGGSHWHAGGKHWTTQEAEEWQTLSAWVMGQSSPSR